MTLNMESLMKLGKEVLETQQGRTIRYDNGF